MRFAPNPVRGTLTKGAAFALTAALLASTSVPALAFDAGDAMKRIESLVGISKATLKYDAPELSGSDVTVNNIVLQTPNGKNEVPLGTLTMTGVSEGDNGFINVEKLDLTPIDYTHDGVTVNLGALTMGDFALPTVEAIQNGLSQTKGTFNLDGMSVAKDGKAIVTVASMSGVATGNFPDEAMEQTVNLTDMTVDLSGLPDGDQGKQTLMALGYNTLTFDLNTKGNWQPSGELKVDQFEIAGDDIGTLGLTLDISGYTAELAKKVAELNAKMSGENSGAASMQLLGELQSLTLNGGQLKFSDNSITEKLLNFFAPQMGTDANGLKAQAKGMLPLALGQLGDPDLTKMVSAAVGQYLDDPKSLQIDLVPDAPVAFGEIMGAGMAAPQTLPKVLGAKVSANQ